MAKVIPLTPSAPTDAAPALTVAGAVVAFLERDFADNTRRNLASDLGRFAKVFGGRPVDGIGARELRGYLQGLTTRRDGQERPVRPQTHNRHYGTLRNLFGWLVRQEELDANPMDKVERQRVGERLPRPMSPAQIRALFGRLDGLREKTLFSLLHGSGLRVCEALRLDIEDVDLEAQEFRVVGKGDRERVGYLAEDTTKLLRRYLRERGRPRQGPLFVSRSGNRLSYAMVWRLFRKYSEGLDVDGCPLTIHQLRHAFGSERAGQMDALILRDLMGHRSLRTTQQYARVSPAAARDAFRAFDRSE